MSKTSSGLFSGTTGSKQGIGEHRPTKPYKATKALRNHIDKRDPSVPAKRGIGGCHNKNSFMKENVEIVSIEPNSQLDGVSKITYHMPKLDIT